MTTTTFAPAAQDLWFLHSRVSFPVAAEDGADGISVMDARARFGDSPPLHVHSTEDEAFHVVEGTLRFRRGDEEMLVHAGGTALAPKGVPHTYRVESDEARWLVFTTKGDFERFVRSISRPAEHEGLPAGDGPPSEEQQRALVDAAAAHGIRFVGPPLA